MKNPGVGASGFFNVLNSMYALFFVGKRDNQFFAAL
jgi:hypothetical protein